MSLIICRSMATLTCVVHLGQANADQRSIDPQNLVDWRKSLAVSSRLYEEGHFTEAELVLKEAVHYAETFAAQDVRLPTTVHALGFLYHQQGKYSEAKDCYLRAIHLWETMGPSQHDRLLQSLDNLIGIYVETQDYRAAKKLLASRLPEMERFAKTWEDRATLLNTQATLADAEHHYDQAESLYRGSLALWEEHAGGQDKNTALVWTNLSHLFTKIRHYQDALDATVRALAIFENLGPTVSPFIVRALDDAAFICMRLQRPNDAELYYNRALAMANDVFGANHQFTCQIMLSYSSTLRRLQRTAEAKKLTGAAHAILRNGKEKRNNVDVIELHINAR